MVTVIVFASLLLSFTGMVLLSAKPRPLCRRQVRVPVDRRPASRRPGPPAAWTWGFIVSRPEAPPWRPRGSLRAPRLAVPPAPVKLPPLPPA